MLANNPLIESKFSPSYSKRDLLSGKYLLRKQVCSDEISRLFVAKNIITKEFVHLRLLTKYFTKFISDAPFFLSELQFISSSLSPDHIDILDWGISNESIYLIWPLERLKSLNSLVIEQGMFKKEDALKISLEVITFLIEADAKFSRPHLIIGSKNIYVNSEGEIRYSDYGIAAYLFKKYPFFNIKDFFEFHPPESMGSKNQHFSYDADIYQLACVLYLMITGRLPEKTLDRSTYSFYFSKELNQYLGKDFLEVFRRMTATSGQLQYSSYRCLQAHIIKLINGESIDFKVTNERSIFNSESRLNTRSNSKLQHTVTSGEFCDRMNEMKDVSTFIRNDSIENGSKYLSSFIFVAIILILSTFGFLVYLLKIKFLT